MPFIIIIIIIISKKSGKGVYGFLLILRIKSSLQMCCNRTVYFNIRVIQFKFYCNSMIPQPLPNFKSLFSQREEVGSYDNIAPNQRFTMAFLDLRLNTETTQKYTETVVESSLEILTWGGMHNEDIPIVSNEFPI